MTIPNRTVSLTGVFAKEASTTIPSSPVSGVSYRDTSLTKETVEEGWPYKEIVDSGSFNQMMYEYAYITDQIEKYGFLPWCSLTDYAQGALCLGSNGVIYQAVQATGPSTTSYDPVSDTNHTYWADFVGSTYVTLSTTQTITGTKTFNVPAYFNKCNVHVTMDVTRGTRPSSNTVNGYAILDKNGKTLGSFDYLCHATTGQMGARMTSQNQNGSSSSYFEIGFTSNNNEFVFATDGVKKGINEWGNPKYSAGVSIATNHTCTSNGWIRWVSNTDPGTETLSINGVEIGKHVMYNYGDAYACMFPVSIGDIITFSGALSCQFFPSKGG